MRLFFALEDGSVAKTSVKKLPPEHRQVLTLFIGGNKIEKSENLWVVHVGKDVKSYIIDDLVEMVKDAGSHERHERKKKSTTRRKMFQIIRDLRDMGIPLVGDSRGVHLARTKPDVRAFVFKLEQKTKADLASVIRLRKAQLESIGEYEKMQFNLDTE